MAGPFTFLWGDSGTHHVDHLRPSIGHSLQPPTKIHVAFALPFQIKLALLFAFFLQLSPMGLTRNGFVPPKNLLKPVADRLAPRLVGNFILPQITPCNARQALLDLVLVQLLRLRPCDSAQRRQPGADMAVPLFARLGLSIARQLQPFPHFSKQGPGLTGGMHPRTPLGQRFIIAALGLGGELLPALDGIGGRAKLRLRFAVQFFGLQRIA